MKLKSSSEAQKLAAEKLLKNCLALKLKSSSEAPKLAAEKLLKNCFKTASKLFKTDSVLSDQFSVIVTRYQLSLSGIRSRSSKTVSEVEETAVKLKSSSEAQRLAAEKLLQNCFRTAIRSRSSKTVSED